MFNFFKKKPVDSSPDIPQVLDLKLGGAIEINTLKFKLLEAQLTCKNISKTQLIQAVGVVQLDNKHFILRYYTDDDGFIQIVLEGGLSDNHITDIKLWYFYDTVSISSDWHWENILANEISQPEVTLNKHVFLRYWNESAVNNPPVAMTETTYSEDKTKSETDQFVMLYRRELDSNNDEFLMLSAEEQETKHQLEHCVVKSTGINIYSTDFLVIS